jgi:hypothetical protein
VSSLEAERTITPDENYFSQGHEIHWFESLQCISILAALSVNFCHWLWKEEGED